MMTILRIIDLSLQVPDDVRVVTNPPEQCRTFHTLDGASVQDLRSVLEGEATAQGYELNHTERASYLRRGECRIEIHLIAPTRLGIRVDDGESLPCSQVFAHGIGCADLVLPVPDDASICPGRERHDEGSGTWSAEWTLRGSTASDVATLMHDALTPMGLRSDGVWPPPKGGAPYWKVEAYSSEVLVQVGITEMSDHVVLCLTLIRSG